MSKLSFLQDILASVFDRNSAGVEARDDRSFSELCDAMMTERSEISGTRLGAAILDRFENSDGAAKTEFFSLLLEQYDIEPEAALASVTAYAAKQSTGNWRDLVLHTEPPRRELLRRLNRVPGATGRLVSMRDALFGSLRDKPSLARVDIDFEHLFNSWFNRGFLVLRQIDWNTPASILEKIIKYEAVHAINDWSDLRGRLEPSDRRCFAFFHPAMPDDPLIFVEVALTSSLPESIQSILTSSRNVLGTDEVDTAVLYSISNCQNGLRGVSFGSFLIKQVVTELKKELPGLKKFRTLSPVPSLMSWIENLPEDSSWSEEIKVASKLAMGSVSGEGDTQMHQMQQLAAEYLLKTRRDDGEPMDAVARFHLGNGASLSSIVPAGDLSKKGLSQSAGIMVSYMYDLDVVEKNYQAYTGDNTIASTAEVTALLRKSE